MCFYFGFNEPLRKGREKASVCFSFFFFELLLSQIKVKLRSRMVHLALQWNLKCAALIIFHVIYSCAAKKSSFSLSGSDWGHRGTSSDDANSVCSQCTSLSTGLIGLCLWQSAHCCTYVPLSTYVPFRLETSYDSHLFRSMNDLAKNKI